MIRLIVTICSALVIAAALQGCAQPQVVQATDCRGAQEPCGLVLVCDTQAMSSVPVTVPVSAIP